MLAVCCPVVEGRGDEEGLCDHCAEGEGTTLVDTVDVGVALPPLDVKEARDEEEKDDDTEVERVGE